MNENGERDFLFSFFQPLDQLSHRLARSNLTINGQRTGTLDERSLVFAGERENAPHFSLTGAPLFPEKKFADLPGLRTDLFCLLEKALRHPGGIEDPVGLFHPHPSGLLVFDVPSNERERFLVEGLDFKVVDPDDHVTEERGREG